MHAIGDMARAYREHLTALPHAKAYPEGEPDPLGAQLLAHLAEPEGHAALARCTTCCRATAARCLAPVHWLVSRGPRHAASSEIP